METMAFFTPILMFVAGDAFRREEKFRDTALTFSTGEKPTVPTKTIGQMSVLKFLIVNCEFFKFFLGILEDLVFSSPRVVLVDNFPDSSLKGINR
jgi:hypothetical protein